MDQYIVNMVKITQLEDVITVDILETFLSSSLHFFAHLFLRRLCALYPFAKSLGTRIDEEEKKNGSIWK